MDRIFLFDLGNVLAKSLDDYYLYNKLNCKIPYNEFLQYWWSDDLVLKAHMGLVTDEEHIDKLLRLCKSDLSINQFYEIYNSLDSSLYDETIEIINELKNKGYKVGLLSNLRLMDYKRYEQQIGKINFDYIFLSYKMKCIKPSNDIYLQVINTLKCDPDNIIFFDDNEKNVNIANQLGINAYQVTGENIKEVFYKKINI